ncbi:MAG: hypothetical protein FWF22_09490, partial [Treponema sp.]|nr:hypothetical protein [Treponema sp.]
ADQSLRRLLGDAADLGIFSVLEGEDNPVYLYDYALSLQEDMLANPGAAQKAAWKIARNDYFSGLDRFLNGPSETKILENLGLVFSGGIYQDENSYDPASEQILARQQSVTSAFSGLRDKYNEILQLRSGLQSSLADTFCILGQGSVNASVPNKTWTDTEASALLANSIITGRTITPGEELYLFIGAAVAALLAAFVLRTLKPFSGLLAGLIMTLLAGVIFSVAFIYTGIWYDPLVPAAAVATAALVSFVWAFLLLRSFKRRFRTCYGPYISKSGLRCLIGEGRPRTTDVIVQNAVIIAIRNSELILQEDRDKPESSVKSILKFREKAAQAFSRAGGVITGNGGDVVIACFGSPLERIVLGKNAASPEFAGSAAAAAKAAGFLAELLKSPDSNSWSFGVDAGLCAFAWTPLSGYSAFGRPVIRSRILSGFNERYHTRILVSGSVNETLQDLPAKKLGILREKDGYGSEPFYELLL